VTAALTGAPADPVDEPIWGRWFRQIDALPRSGEVLMEGARGRPLLVLDRVGKGRVAQLMSDQIWLWARNFEGGGPHAELLRRLSHWLMKEPSLEEDSLSATLPARGVMEITRRSLKPEDDPVTVTFPSGRVESVTLQDRGDGSSVATLAVDEAGLYRLADATRTALAAVGSLNPLEFRDVAATEARMKPAVEATGGGIVWLADDGMPNVRRLPRGRAMAGAGGFGPWIGLQQNNAYVVRGVSEIPILPSLALLLLALGALILAWRREGR